MATRQDWIDGLRGVAARSVELSKRWDITHLMLDLEGQAVLHQRLKATPGWCEAYKDARAANVSRC